MASESGYYDFRSRGPSPRQVRHTLLTDLIREVHATWRGIHGYRRVHAELTVVAAWSSRTAPSDSCWCAPA